MPLLQSTIVNKYLATLDRNKIDDAYQRFCAYFHDAERQKNIMQSKEEQFQEGFLRELFVKILGYTLNPDPGFDLITEKKDTKDAKKADGAILVSGEVVAVIELKDHKTPDLDKVERQAFGYKNQHKKATYVITSNFHLLRFYIDNAVEYLEWNLFKLTREEFAMLWLCLSHEYLMSGLPKTLKNESVSNEEQITNQLYKDYITFKRELFADILSRNTSEDGERSAPEWKILLFKKTQKLLDRLLFIFFAEDGGLLPPNATVGIINDWQKLKDLDAYTPLYSRLRQYFSYLDQGKPEKGIFAYNGGLFKPDEVLDALLIDDEILATHTRKLSEYDFCSDVDVNILGHIFENSLSEIEEVTAQLEQGEAPAVSKRKKDGVFYTPQYITKYIVENTVGRLCAEKKATIGINDIDYFSDEKLSTKRKQQMMATITEYREWLLQLTICDPACGSGAFLNAALRFLMDEHHTLDEMEANITGSTIVFENIENSILENNLYGVDINEESVEIARLALWLRTAKPQRKLSSLNNNIKCGNSLISDPTVAGDKAFDWEKEFPQVFAKGGFDVVVGNPPYVRADSPGNTLDFREYMVSCKNWETLGGKWDLYIPFLELAIKISKKTDSLQSLIIPDAYCHAEYAKNSQRFMKGHKFLYMIDYYPDINVFDGVGVKSVIVNFDKSCSGLFIQRIHDKEDNFTEQVHNEYPEHLRYDVKQSLMQGEATIPQLNQICYISKGIVGNSDEKYFKGEFEVGDLLSYEKDELHCKLYYEGKNIGKWVLIQKRFIEYGNERSPKKWSRKCFSELFEGSSKIVTMRSPGNCPRSFIDNDGGYFNESAIGFKRWCDLKGIENGSLSKSCSSIEERLKYEELSAKFHYNYLLAILNSSLVKYELNSNRRSNIHIYPEDWKSLPIPVCPDQQPFITLADQMLTLTADLQKLRSRFHRRMTENLEDLKKITTALETFDHLSFEEFNKELKKQKVKLSLTQQDEWEEYFAQNKQRCADIEAQIAQTDKEIDRLVYQLYGLTEEEIAIVEDNG